MKKIITMIMITLISTLFFCSIALGAETRTEIGVIITADKANNYWEVLDIKGNAWYFKDGEDLECNDLVKIHFNTLNTSSIYDDKITKIFCIGYVNDIENFIE